MANKKYSLQEKNNYYQGILTAKEDLSWCKSKKDYDNCLSTRYRMLALSKQRKNKNDGKNQPKIWY